jgi:hypothetical protein
MGYVKPNERFPVGNHIKMTVIDFIRVLMTIPKTLGIIINKYQTNLEESVNSELF